MPSSTTGSGSARARTSTTIKRLREWLEKRHLEHGSPEKALELAQDRFKVAPAKRRTTRSRRPHSTPANRTIPGPTLRPALITTLGKSNGLYALIDIHLEEGEVAEALEGTGEAGETGPSAQPAWGFTYGASSGSYSARVAAAAEADFPDEAVRIYRRLADQLIAERGRANYQTAAAYLVRVKHVLEGNGRAAEWSTLIADLRAANKSLRALKEELDVLGLA